MYVPALDPSLDKQAKHDIHTGRAKQEITNRRKQFPEFYVVAPFSYDGMAPNRVDLAESDRAEGCKESLKV